MAGMSSHEVDRTVDAIARRQHGVLTRQQARDAGLTVRMIDTRLASGAWIALARGIYAFAAHPATWHRQLKAAELSIPGSAVSHRAAAALHGLEGFRPGRIELTATPTSSGRSPLAVVHRRATVPSTSIDHIAVVRLPRVLLDLAGQLDPPRWSAVLDDALVGRRTTLADVPREYELLAPTKCRGVGAVRSVLDHLVDGIVPAANELERALRRVLDDPRLPVATHQSAFPVVARCAVPGGRVPSRHSAHHRGRRSALAHPRG
jgi:Transcriptional regulator, AbiEi antitoxin